MLSVSGSFFVSTQLYCIFFFSYMSPTAAAFRRYRMCVVDDSHERLNTSLSESVKCVLADSIEGA